jgi:hypothetical protein
MSFYKFDSDVPAEFAQAAASLAEPILRKELKVEQIQSPQGIAPHALAFSAEIPNKASESKNRGVGRIVFIYDDSQIETWGGNMRIIAYGKSPLMEVEQGVQDDPTHWYWGTLTRALSFHGAEYINEAGTVTVMTSKGMGSLLEDSPTNEIELRASWSPTDGNFSSHFAAWQDLIAGMAGYSPDGDSVVQIPVK